MYGRAEPRQQPGYACEECRKKKLRCDRQRPQCGACANAQISCEVNDRRAPRGPKKGSIGALRNRIMALERRLSSSQTDDNLASEGHEFGLQTEPPARENVTTQFSVPNWDMPHHEPPNAPISLPWGPPETSPHSPLVFSDIPILPAAAAPYPSPKQSPDSISEAFVPDLTKAELIQLYFDRVHPIVPILNKSKAFKWISEANNISEPQQCLLHAMWTSATAFSSQLGSFQDTIYAKTRYMLDQLDSSGNDPLVCHIEHIQAWILITFYEFARTNYRRGWLSAGRVFRLVQFSRLYDLDSPKPLASDSENDPILLEEKRRTFWVAYCLDRFISVSEGAPMTLNEEVVCTRLPCIDGDFQRGLVPQESFLGEAMSSADTRPYAPLAECVILVTICSRALSHKQIYTIETLYSNMPLDFSSRYNWLDGMLTRRLNNLQANYPSFSVAEDAMIIFAYTIAHSAVIYLCRIIETLSRNDQDQSLVWQFQARGLWAAQEISRLAKEHDHFGFFKAHTFMPFTIYLSAARLSKHLAAQKCELGTKDVKDVEKSFRTSIESLQKLQSVNNLANYYLHLL
ncbi:fungal-specific transcription factor domain-containing protein [Hypoxylon trugodes]|uniref:fungal-specific transcription factor domain-containing protein n=1 Tax=Hypoxylon trugodes TaxID=326681 RepID=UPI0021991F1E|nr:fungal-specific transcription factor domain-containing protein [Hypoxylon trugodes]KAI1385803.1 fungal-specific transcription factor domain-containing protein [Hypoxylon trugodes]